MKTRDVECHQNGTTSPKLIALMKKLGAMPKDAIKSPLITGPIIRPEEITALFKATALGKSAAPTSAARQRSSACQINTGGDQDDAGPIRFVWPLAEEWYCKQR